MTRTVLDTALMLDVMAGPDSRDPLTVARDKPDFIAAVRTGGSLSGSTVGSEVRLASGWRGMLVPGNLFQAQQPTRLHSAGIAQATGEPVPARPDRHPSRNPQRAACASRRKGGQIWTPIPPPGSIFHAEKTPEGGRSGSAPSE